MRYFFEPGDTLVCAEETFDFHKGEKYEISKMFQKGDKVIIYMKDKNGIDRLKWGIEWEEHSATTIKNSFFRQLEARLFAAWQTKSYIINDEERKMMLRTVYKVSTGAHYVGAGREDYKAHVDITQTRTDSGEKNHTTEYFKSYEEYLKYFKDKMPKDTDRVNLYWDWMLASTTDAKGMGGETAAYNDMLTWLSIKQFPKFEGEDPSEIGWPNKHYPKKTVRDMKYCDLPFPEYCDILAQRTFDVPKMTDPKQKELVRDIATVFGLLPPSYGVTSVAKLLAGQGKADKMAKVKDYFGKYNKYLKSAQMWDFVDNVDSYMHVNGIFMTKDAYDTWAATGKKDDQRPPDWIGTKAIDRVKLAETIKTIE